MLATYRIIGTFTVLAMKPMLKLSATFFAFFRFEVLNETQI